MGLAPEYTRIARPARELFRGGHLSQVVAAELADGRQVVVKGRPSARGSRAASPSRRTWESQNIRWAGGQPLAVDDWDSVIAQPEPAIVGLAAAVWPADGAPGQAATVAQSREFIASYQRPADSQWSRQETEDAWAAGLWVRLFNARKDAACGGGPQLDRLTHEIAERVGLAALGNR